MSSPSHQSSYRLLVFDYPTVRPSNRPTVRLYSFCLLASACLCQAEPISANSPFLPVPGQSKAADKAGPLQLSGITIIASKTYVCLTETSTKKSRWLAVGAKVDAIEVLSCNPEKNEAVVRVNGESLTLSLRNIEGSKAVQPVAANNSPAAAPPQEKADDIAAKIKPLVTREEKEREARMLVSDLLDISMRQRKAYEEARKKADVEAAKKK
ncbi:MAG: hypothetical protein WC378_14420 [Opitutaceae bacterium]|jgi:hypothetical protein